jgi:hypothetical protein
LMKRLPTLSLSDLASLGSFVSGATVIVNSQFGSIANSKAEKGSKQ